MSKIEKINHDEVLKQYRECKNMTTVSNNFNVSMKLIKKILKIHGVVRILKTDYAKQKGTKIDRINHNEVIEEYNNCKNLDVIGKKFNVSGETIKKILTIGGVYISPKLKIKNIDHEELIFQYNKIKNINIVAKIFDVSPTTINKILKGKNIEIKKMLSHEKKNIISKVIETFNTLGTIEKTSNQLHISNEVITKILDNNNIDHKKLKRLKIGDIFGKLEIIKENGSHVTDSGRYDKQFLCKCKCGNIVTVTSNRLRNGKKSCGCLLNEIKIKSDNKKIEYKTRVETNKKLLESIRIKKQLLKEQKIEDRKQFEEKNGLHVGDKKYRLTILSIENVKDRTYIKNNDTVLVQCDCGVIKTLSGQNLKHNSNSCGCLQVERSTKHGFASKTDKVVRDKYNRWKGMVSRCTKENNHAYKDYGGRGIKVCDRWLEPNGMGCKNYLDDIDKYLGERPTPTHSIDRINNDGNYEISNVRWATPSEQGKNQRRSKKNRS